MKERILMCKPEFYGIKYEINPWMDLKVQADAKKAETQWQSLYKILTKDLGTQVVLIEPKEEVPDMVFTANAALMFKNNAIISRFKFSQRKKEEKYFAKWFSDNDYNVHLLPDYMSFEGAGDALFYRGVLFAGYVPRSDFSAHTYLSELIGIPVLSLELASGCFYHLDTCFCPLENDYLIYYPGAFDEYANKVIENHVEKDKRIVVNDEEALCFTCNAVNLGKNVITNITSKRFAALLKDKGFNHIQTDLSEFMKAGGSAKCLTLKI